jgi:hypothetical protein
VPPSIAQERRNTDIFRVYPEDNSEPEDGKASQPPEVLVRVVTKFDDFDGVI